MIFFQFQIGYLAHFRVNEAFWIAFRLYHLKKTPIKTCFATFSNRFGIPRPLKTETQKLNYPKKEENKHSMNVGGQSQWQQKTPSQQRAEVVAAAKPSTADGVIFLSLLFPAAAATAGWKRCINYGNNLTF